MIQIFLSFLAGVLTAFSPCILPILPVLFSIGVGQKKSAKPIFLILGFITFFSLAALTLSFVVPTLHLLPQTLRQAATVILIFFGLSLVFPNTKLNLFGRFHHLANPINRLTQKISQENLKNFAAGMSLGLIWTPCAGPILGSILTLIASGKDIFTAITLILFYSAGAATPMLLITYGGKKAMEKIKQIQPHTETIQKIAGLILISMAILIFFRIDLLFQAQILQLFPKSYPSL